VIAEMFEEQREMVLSNVEQAHTRFYESEIFGGPSLHFHLKALEAAQENDPENFFQFSYAMLASWGMHRMGVGGSKMGDFGPFRASILPIWPLVKEMQSVSIFDVSEGHWKILRTLFCSIKCMATGTSLVGNSKVLAHLLPNLVPPIDRQYTLNLLYGNGRIVNGLDREWSIFREVLDHFFYPLAANQAIEQAFDNWFQTQEFKWDTSRMKVLDNLVIGVVKLTVPTKA
jgi:hypothetical protein